MTLTARPLAILLLTCISGAPCLAAPPNVALTNVLYRKFADSPAEAYTRALYYERRGVDSSTRRQLDLARAGLALDMGMFADAKQILTGVDEQTLPAPERDRLHFFLARSAYGNRDWQRLSAELARIDPHAAILESAMGRYLRVEADRAGGRFTAAANLLNRMPGDDLLVHYGRFNLAASANAAGQPALARTQLERLIASPSPSLEALLITERGRVALASLDVSAAHYADATRLLDNVTATGSYGPAAIAALAQLAMARGDYGRAAKLWQYLLTNSPWQPGAREVHAALPYSLEKLDGSAAAYPAYQAAEAQLVRRRQRLRAISGRIRTMNPAKVARVLRHPREPDSAAAPMLRALGTDFDWSHWLADAKSQAIAARLERLSAGLGQLQQRRSDLDILLRVDAEQQRRIHEAAVNLARGNQQAHIDAARAQLQRRLARLQQLAAEPPFDDRLADFATPHELALLHRIEALHGRARKAGATTTTMARIATLRNLVLYRIFDDLPVRIRRRQVATNALCRLLDKAQARIDRIRQAARTLGNAGSVGNRIRALSARTDALLGLVRRARDTAGRRLIARLEANLDEESRDVQRQLTYVRLQMARIDDARILANESAR